MMMMAKVSTIRSTDGAALLLTAHNPTYGRQECEKIRKTRYWGVQSV